MMIVPKCQRRMKRNQRKTECVLPRWAVMKFGRVSCWRKFMSYKWHNREIRQTQRRWRKKTTHLTKRLNDYIIMIIWSNFSLCRHRLYSLFSRRIPICSMEMLESATTEASLHILHEFVLSHESKPTPEFNISAIMEWTCGSPAPVWLPYQIVTCCPQFLLVSFSGTSRVSLPARYGIWSLFLDYILDSAAAKNTKRTLKGANGTAIPILGEVTITVDVGWYAVLHRWQDLFCNMFGIDFLVDNNAVGDFDQSTVWNAAFTTK